MVRQRSCLATPDAPIKHCLDCRVAPCASKSSQALQIVAHRKPSYVCNAPESDQILPRSGMSRRAITELMHCNKKDAKIFALTGRGRPFGLSDHREVRHRPQFWGVLSFAMIQCA